MGVGDGWGRSGIRHTNTRFVPVSSQTCRDGVWSKRGYGRGGDIEFTSWCQVPTHKKHVLQETKAWTETSMLPG